MDIQYRKINFEDIPILTKMRIIQLQEEGAVPQFDLAPHLEDYYKRHMADNTFISWVATYNDSIIATSGLSVIEKPPYYSCPTGKIGMLSSMYTLKQYRRQGIASALLEKLVHEAKQCGCTAIHITASQQGILLYTNFGFKKRDNFMCYNIE